MARDYMSGLPRIVMSAALVLLASGVALGQPAPAAAPADKAEALSEAARKGDAAAVARLLAEGVDVDTKYRYGVTALFYACDHGHLDVVKVLLDHGADVNVTDTFYHATPLTWATNSAMGRKPEHAQIVGLLLAHGAKGREDALQSAVRSSDAAMTRVILEQGGFSPDTLSGSLELAKQRGDPEIPGLLEHAGAKPYVEFKMDDAQLARYAGTYRDARGNDLVLTVKNGRLSGGPAGQPLTLMARDETTFRALEAPGLTVTFRIEQGRVTMLDLGRDGQSAKATYTRVEGT
jgi:hypothetical protein